MRYSEEEAEVVHLEMRSWVEVTFGGCSDEGRGAGQARGELAWEEPTVGLRKDVESG